MDVRLELASRFLSALISRDPKRSIESRLSEVRHALELAEVLMAHAQEPVSAQLDEQLLRHLLEEGRQAIEPDTPRDHSYRHLPPAPGKGYNGRAPGTPSLH